MFEYVIMGMVLHEASTGYDIKKNIEAGIGFFCKASHGSLYPSLKKLTSKGYLTMTEQTQGKRLKKYYLTTESGKMAFLEWLASPFDIDTHMIQIFFLGELPAEIRNKWLQECEFYLQQMLQQLQAIEKHFPAEISNDRDYFQLSTSYFSYQNIQNLIKWVGYIKEQKPLKAREYQCQNY